MRKLILINAIAVVVVACGSEPGAGVGSSGLTEAQAEEICREWCTSKLDRVCEEDCRQTCCGGFDHRGNCAAYCTTCKPVVGEPCLVRCMGVHSQHPCNWHLTAKKACELELDCNDEFNDCAIHQERAAECHRAAEGEPKLPGSR